MKKVYLFVVLSMMFCNVAYSEWIKLTSSSNATIYIDLETLTQDQGTNYVWVLIDQKEVLDNSRSRTVHIQIDCNKGKRRLHHVVTYDDQMGKGDMVDQATNPGEWISILPGSLGNSVKKIICN
tara:strand:+ start:122 stop:493 length:372 start_codon:yes stop_codon:yes gene_type:complete